MVTDTAPVDFMASVALIALELEARRAVKDFMARRDREVMWKDMLKAVEEYHEHWLRSGEAQICRNDRASRPLVASKQQQ